jgi:hypothetical protein
MTRNCYHIEELSEIADLQPGHPRLAHAQECARCRGLLTAIREFRAPRRIPEGADPDTADDRLTAALDSEIRRARAIAKTAHPDDEPAGWWIRQCRALWAPGLRPVWGLGVAAVLVLMLVQVVPQSMREEQRLVRDAAPTGAEAPALLPPQQADDNTVRLSWRRTTGADSYQVLLLDIDLDEVARFDAGSDTLFILTEDLVEPLSLPPGQQVLWQVAAHRRGDQLTISRPGSLRLP